MPTRTAGSGGPAAGQPLTGDADRHQRRGPAAALRDRGEWLRRPPAAAIRGLRRRVHGGVRSWPRRAVAGRDVGWTYAAVVVAVQIVLGLVPPATRTTVVAVCSTNLANLRQYPPLVLVASAFVVASPWELVLLPVLVSAYGAVQRWLGRAATVIMAVLAHAGATVFVATMLAARVQRGEVPASVASSVDVGVSYGLAGVAGLLTARAADRVRRWLVVVASLGLLALVLSSRSFADLGHLVAWGIGVAVATLVRRGVASAGPRDDLSPAAPTGTSATRPGR